MATLLATSTMLIAAAITTPPAPHNARPGCPKTYTMPMIARAIDATYNGTRDVTARDRAHMHRYLHCIRSRKLRPRALSILHAAQNAWRARRNPPMVTQLASWYNDAGATACGFHALYGVANKTLPCGTHVRFAYHGRAVDAIVQDRGPYVGGRVWDFNQNVAGALGFSGVDYVQSSVAG